MIEIVTWSSQTYGILKCRSAYVNLVILLDYPTSRSVYRRVAQVCLDSPVS